MSERGPGIPPAEGPGRVVETCALCRAAAERSGAGA